MQSLKSRDDLGDDQTRFIEIIKEKRFIYLAMPMGNGKTVTSITAAIDLLNEWSLTQLLIGAPLEVAESTWPNELKAWEHLKGEKYAVLTGTAEARARAARRRVPIHIINRENVQWLA